MNAGLATMLAGLFIVPVALLYLGHRLRRRSRRARAVFWGALIGHTLGALFATWYSMIPPEAWTSSDTTRGFFGFYGMLVLSVAGGLIGLLAGSRNTNEKTRP
jgi:hypothetical protein